MTTTRVGPLPRRFADRSVATKVLLSTVAGLVATVVVGGTALAQLGALRDGARAIGEGDVVRLTHVTALDQGFSTLLLGTVTKNQAPTERDRAAGVTLMTDGTEVIDRELAAYAATADGPRRDLVARFAEPWAQFKTVVQQIAPLAPDDPRLLGQLGPRANTLTLRLQQALTDISTYERTSAAALGRQADAAYDHARLLVLLALIGSLVAALLLAHAVSRAIVVPLREVRRVALAMAAGDLTQHLAVAGRDEVGETAAAVNEANAQVRQVLGALATSAQGLAASGDRLSSISAQIAASASEASGQASIVADAASQVSQNVQTVAVGSDQMRTSIAEIARNTSDGAMVAGEAVRTAASTNDIVSKLGDSSAQIGDVIKVITSIAEQTNLLALNATIEAARAGDAGKGFAVVASEVKELARETARATEDIATQVETIQADTRSAVAAIGRISAIIEKINDYQVTVTAAVEEQSATTTQMNRNVADAAQGSSDIAATIGAVAVATEQTQRGSAENHRAAQDLAAMATELRTVASRFRLT